VKRIIATILCLLPVPLAAGAEQLVPAGSVMQCIVSDKVSSKTTNVGDPVLCMVSHSEMYGRSTFPYGSYLVGHFEEYKDPGHFVGKGWMELKFDRMVMGNDTQVPINARVIATSQKNAVDRDGRIHGTGHAVRDTVEWMVPVLWPIDLINLPRRGPTPVLKPETRLTLKLLDDVGLPTKQEVQHQPELVSRFNYSDPTPAPVEQDAAPIERAYSQQAAAPPQSYPQSYGPAPVQQAYTQPSPTVIVVQAAAPVQQQPIIIQQQQPPVVYNNYPAPVAYAYPRVPPPYAYARPYPGSGYYFPGW
jgi:hypothetical protein